MAPDRSPVLRLALAAALAGAALTSGARPARANGRPAHTIGVQFWPGQPERILLPVTFGLLVSDDGGESFRWVCETAIGYTGTFDPDYALTAAGDIYASSKMGLRRSRDGGCTFETVAADVLGDEPTLSEVELGPDGRLWVATKNTTRSNDVYVSADGVSFTSSPLASDTAWWVSLRTTPADPLRIYASGLQPAGDAPAAALLRRSDDGGATWQELPVGQFELSSPPELTLLGVSPEDPDLVFARSARVVGTIGDALYRSPDGGATWTKVAGFADVLTAFRIRPDGQTVMAGSIRACPEEIIPGQAVPRNGCVRSSSDGGATWTRPAEQPRLACLGQRSDGVLFGCGENFEPDNFALGRSDDGERWQPVFRFQDTVGPLACGAGTEQARCAAEVWPTVCPMAFACPLPGDGGPGAQDGGAGGDGGGGGGCCRVGGQAADGSWLPGAALVLLGLARPRRRRRR